MIMRKTFSTQKFRLLAVASAVFAATLALRAQTVTQTFNLSPGWNAIYLEVTPPNTNISAVFNSPAIDVVWQPLVRNSTVAFIQNANEIPFNKGGWLVYTPTNQIASVNNNLYAVSANTPYLIKVNGTGNVILNVSGRPSLQSLDFNPDALTLRGFNVDPAHAPTFQNFFKYSAAHYNNGNGPINNIYRLNPSGSWQVVNAADTMARGVAYWVSTLGASSYQAPLTVTSAGQDGLDFGAANSQANLSLQNTTGSPMTVTVADVGGLPHPLQYYYTDTGKGTNVWVPMGLSMTTNIPAGTNITLQVGLRRSQIVSNSYATVLAISDGNGTLARLPVTAVASSIPLAGLWVGDVTVNAVAETYNNLTNTTRTASPFTMRAILHVMPNGTTRFLREAIEMEQNPITTTNASGVAVTGSSQYVLLTDNSLVPNYSGVAVRNGVTVGRRVSTAAYDFDPPGGTNFLTMSGLFGVNNSVAVAITLKPTTPTNPFLHRYHPDHDNLNDSYQALPAGAPQEVFTVIRNVQFTFTPADPTGATATDYGVNEIGGTYRETLTGLHRNPLVVSGTFHLTHTLNVPYLNENQ